MKKVAMWVGIGVGGLVTLVFALWAWVELTSDLDFASTPEPAIVASTDPAVIARGKYLVHAVAHCSTCHSPAENVKQRRLDFSAPLTGGYRFEAGPFGTYTAANITPHEDGIGSMSDGQVARVVRHAVARSGQFAPFMLFGVGAISDVDLTAVVSWLRAQPPAAGKPPGDEFGFLAKALSGKFGPRMGEPPAHVAEGGVSIERGRYLAEGPANCRACHSPLDPMQGFALSGAAFSGSIEPEPDQTDAAFELVAPNLTPDEKTGHITSWSEDAFVQRFGAGRAYLGSPMPWEAFARLTQDDVRSLYRFLRSLPGAVHDVGPSRRAAGSFKSSASAAP